MIAKIEKGAEVGAGAEKENGTETETQGGIAVDQGAEIAEAEDVVERRLQNRCKSERNVCT